MANCLAFLGHLTPSYPRQYRALPEIASHGRHCDIYPRSWLLCLCHRALVRNFSPIPTVTEFGISEGCRLISRHVGL